MSNQRSFEVDVIRMVALIGIGIVNVPFMAIPVTEMFSTPQSSWDQLATVFVEAFFLLKFFFCSPLFLVGVWRYKCSRQLRKVLVLPNATAAEWLGCCY